MSVRPEIPSSGRAGRALRMAAEHESPAIANHSIRTFLHASLAARHFDVRAGSDYDEDELFCACALHDIGTADAYDGPQRFEVEGADAAAAFLADEGADEAAITRIWEAIALHTSPGIAERLGPLTRLTRLGVLADFGGPAFGTREQIARIESEYPRLDIELTLADAVVRQALRQPSKAPSSSWPGGLLRAHLARPDETGLNAAF